MSLALIDLITSRGFRTGFEHMPSGNADLVQGDLLLAVGWTPR